MNNRLMSSTPVALTLYTRRNCSLCADMVFTLNEFATDLQFSFDQIDIDKDPVLVARFNDLVPVLALGDHEICHHFFDLKALKSALEAECTSQ